ncbi:MAG: hypothetical protein PHE20_02930 [Patescibacteria group bacterium]|nr:hypothetical protein [Patescibacteria group bacterium]
MNYELEVIDFKDDEVVLKDKNNRLIYWPKDNLSRIPVIGQMLNFSIGATDKTELLNELLHTDN